MGTVSVFRTEELTDAEKKQLAFIFDKFTGATEKDTKGWRRFAPWLWGKELGEVFDISIKRVRHGVFHRKHMKMESLVFESQERFTDFDRFRDWVKIGAGFVEWVPGAKGGIVPLPKSIAYDKCEQDEYEDFHGSVIDFFLTEHCQHFLWRHLEAGQAAEMMNTLIGSFVVDWWNVKESREQAAAARVAHEQAQRAVPAPPVEKGVTVDGESKRVKEEAVA